MSNVSVRMHLPCINEIPEERLPEGFHFRFYQEGDAQTWVDLYEAAEEFLSISMKTFEDAFYSDDAALCQRMLFLCNGEGKAIGTSTAWYDDIDKCETTGRLHWFAIIPEYQGRGLAKPLICETLKVFKKLDYADAYLLTSTGRIPAITLYLKYGFIPQVQNREERGGWLGIIDKLRNDYQTIVKDIIERPL